MKEITMVASKRKTLKKRSKASYKNLRTHSDKLSSFREGKAMPGTLMKSKVEGTENRADQEMRRLMQDDVMRSAGKKVGQSNVSKRRYK